jgi:hypothetical protein
VNPDEVFERAELRTQEGELFPGAANETRWVATDPQTGCEGVGDFEGAARTALVFAVRAYLEDDDGSVPYVATVEGQTLPKNWEHSEPSIIDKFLSIFKLDN